LPYQGDQLFPQVVCTTAVTVDRTLRKTFIGTFYFIEILPMTSLTAL